MAVHRALEQPGSSDSFCELSRASNSVPPFVSATQNRVTPLADTEWLATHLGQSHLSVVEVSECPHQYFTGHIEGAVRMDPGADFDNLARPSGGVRFAELMNNLGISHHHTVVLYGDNANSYASRAFLLFKRFGHPDVRLLQGGRQAWLAEGRNVSVDIPMVTARGYPVPRLTEDRVQASRSELLRQVGPGVIVDVDGPSERSSATADSAERSSKARDSASLLSIPWRSAVDDCGRFRDPSELARTYRRPVTASGEVVVSCQDGRRSSHTWFVLTQLLGRPSAWSYDGSWLEWNSPVTHQ